MSSSEEDSKSPIVSDSEGSSDDEIITKKKAKKRKAESSDDEKANKPRKKKASLIEDEASESDNDAAELDSSDDDIEELNKFEEDGFVVGEDEESEEETTHRRKKKKKEKKFSRLKQKRDDDLDDEDLLLIEENRGIRINRRKEESDSDDEEIPKSKSSKDLNRDMFGESDSDDDQPVRRRADKLLDGEADYESDDMDEFIVDEDDEGGVRRRRPISDEVSMEGPSELQIDEAQDIFGDIHELMEATRGYKAAEQEAPKKKSKDKLAEKYEPSVLKEYMMTKADTAVRQTDLPERIQRLYAKRKFPVGSEVTAEAEWIASELRSSERGQASSDFVDAISNVLEAFHAKKVEPPFVHRYCKEFWKPAGLKSYELYDIFELDLRWDKLERKKDSVRTLLHRPSDDTEEGSVQDVMASQHIRESYEQCIDNASEAQLKDMAEYLALDSQDQVTMTGGVRLKRPIRRDFYRICRKANLRKLSRLFTLSASIVGGMLHNAQSDRTDVPEPVEDPITLAQEYTCTEFPNPEDVLKGAQHIAACELASEPHVRQTIREMYRHDALIYTTTTQKGRDDIDEFHYCHGLQYLERCPAVELFGSDKYLRLNRAEKEGFIEISFSVDNPYSLMSALETIYLGTEGREWAEIRRRILHEAVNTIMLPSLERELREELLSKARKVVVRECGSALRKRLFTRHYEPKDHAEPCVIAIWVDSPRRDARAYIVALDVNGEVVDKMVSLIDNKEERVAQFTSNFSSFITQHGNTHAIVINTCSGMKCMFMGKFVDEVRRTLQRSDTNRFGNNDNRDYIHVTFVKDDIPRMYARSERAQKEFPDETESMRSAISMGRYLQSPLSEMTALWGMVPLSDPSRGRELLYLNLHPLQRFVGKESLLREYEFIFTDVINRVGVDINLVSNHIHCSYLLQFVCGLGPAKASALMDQVRRQGHVEKRQEIKSNKFLGEVVYRNAAGFLRIRERDTLKEAPLNPLDDTRIHPESYFMAVKMCGDALGNSAVDLYDPDNYSMIVEDIMYQSASEIKKHQRPNDSSNNNAPRRLKDNEIQDSLSELDLVAYAQRLEQEKRGPKSITLENIKKELRYPYFDKRTPYSDPSNEDMLYLLNGETRDSLRIGMILPAQLIALHRHFVRVRLESGVRCNLQRDRLPNYMTRDYLEQFPFPKGTTINARILNFDGGHDDFMEAILGCSDEDIRNPCGNFNLGEIHANRCNVELVQRDNENRCERLLNRDLERLKLLDEEEEENKQRRHPERKKRQIAHPDFHNVDCKGAMQILRERPIGDCVFRPSSKDSNNLTLTWKAWENGLRHYNIEEHDKPSETRLGARLFIKTEEYEDLDEIIARFVQPMNELIDQAFKYEKYLDATYDEAESKLIIEKKQMPSRIPYRLIKHREIPGCFTIVFVPSTKAQRCHLKLCPKGFTFFGKLESSKPLRSIKHAVEYFKKHALTIGRQRRSTQSSSKASQGHHGHKPQDPNGKYNGSDDRHRYGNRNGSYNNGRNYGSSNDYGNHERSRDYRRSYPSEYDRNYRNNEGRDHGGGYREYRR